MTGQECVMKERIIVQVASVQQCPYKKYNISNRTPLKKLKDSFQCGGIMGTYTFFYNGKVIEDTDTVISLGITHNSIIFAEYNHDYPVYAHYMA